MKWITSYMGDYESLGAVQCNMQSFTHILSEFIELHHDVQRLLPEEESEEDHSCLN